VIQVATNNGNYVFALDSTGLTMHDITLQSFLMPGALDFSLVSGGLGGGSVSWTDDGTAAYLLFDSGTAVVSTIDGVMWLFSSGSGIPSQGNNAMLKVGITFGSPCDIELWGNLRIGAVDQGKGLVGSANATANTTFAATETALLTTGSINFENGRAYEVSVWGLASAAADSYALLKLRKGTVAGTIYKDQMRVNNLQASSSNAAVSLQFILTNTTGSDISTAVVLTGIQGAVAQTWTWAASAGNVTHITVKDIGLASQWPGQPIS
jgi:hypothetical protein